MHRVNEIKSNTAPLSWSYIPGYLNPADGVTRPVESKELHQNCRWLTGPECLKQDLFEWSVDNITTTLSFWVWKKLQKRLKLRQY